MVNSINALNFNIIINTELLLFGSEILSYYDILAIFVIVQKYIKDSCIFSHMQPLWNFKNEYFIPFMIVVQYIKCKVPIDPINRIHTVTFHWITFNLLLCKPKNSNDSKYWLIFSSILDRSFSFLPPLRHVFVVNISRISISLKHVQNKIECSEVKR